jgi:hypothetical protein
VKADLRFLVPTGEKPVYIASEGGATAQLSISASFENRQVEVADARALTPAASLDREGFALVSQRTAIEDFYALDAVRDTYDAVRDNYEDELKALFLEHTGARDLLLFDHTLRSDAAEIRGDHNSREPATVVHNDYSDESAEQRLRDLLPTKEAEQRLTGRYAIVNAWRSITGTVLSSPLTCCDARTLFEEDLIASERRARERTGELQLLRFNEQQRWYYYPAMQPDEVLLIKTFDSAGDGCARRSAHSAFDLPHSDAPPRESIESRALVFF